MNIRILKLKNGDDIICDMELDGDTYYINHPMVVWMDNNGKTPKLCMDHWLPVQVIEDNSTTLNVNDVLCTLIPNSQLTEYFMNQVDEMNSVLEAKKLTEGMSDDDIVNTILALQEGFGSTIH